MLKLYNSNQRKLFEEIRNHLEREKTQTAKSISIS